MADAPSPKPATTFIPIQSSVLQGAAATEIKTPEQLKEIEKYMVAAAKNKASDLHLKVGQKPILRVNTIIHEIGNKVLSGDDVRRMMYEIMSEQQRDRFETEHDLDFAYSIAGVGRFRINVFYERGSVAVAMRRVNTTIPSFNDLNLPAETRKITEFEQGLIIVAGPTGSGKSTTLACIIDHINANQKSHIVTVEDPIEYLFQDKKSFVNQREIGIDVPDFHQALKYVVRQDPDVILVGEMRDYVSFDAALMAAETGHLVFATIHASSAPQCIGRLLDLFPTERQPLIRQSLAFNLKAILCQRLLPACKEGIKVVPAVEVLFNNATAQKIIMTCEDKKLADLIRASKEEGMQDFNMSFVDLINCGLISKKVALQYSPNPEQLKMNLQGIYLGDDHKILG
ncbi:MAG TPA: PilT/PilU family type 4a pilus ATPase [Planctomycetota bacterium]|nr:PilT/PilU family type 4a pilus ATPase [Planctomycetota bacterium]